MVKTHFHTPREISLILPIKPPYMHLMKQTWTEENQCYKKSCLFFKYISSLLLSFQFLEAWHKERHPNYRFFEFAAVAMISSATRCQDCADEKNKRDLIIPEIGYYLWSWSLYEARSDLVRLSHLIWKRSLEFILTWNSAYFMQKGGKSSRN